MDRLAIGDRSAFDPLYLALHPRAVSIARRRLRDEALALDAAQESMIRVFSRASEFARGAHVLPWFYAVCANEVRAIERRRGVLAPNDAAPEEASGEASAEDQLQSAELHRALEHALASLDLESAEAISALLGESTKPEIAGATFRKRVSRAYAKLRILLGRYHAV